MKKYAVAVCNLLNNGNEVKIVSANNDVEAMILAVEGEILDIGTDNLTEVQQYYFDGEISVSIPVEIK